MLGLEDFQRLGQCHVSCRCRKSGGTFGSPILAPYILCLHYVIIWPEYTGSKPLSKQGVPSILGKLLYNPGSDPVLPEDLEGPEFWRLAAVNVV